MTENEFQDFCRAELSGSFNAVAAYRARFAPLEVYNVDWDNLGNDKFVENGSLNAIYALISGTLPLDAQGFSPGHLTLRIRNGALRCVGVSYRTHDGGYCHTERMKGALAYAQNWLQENGNDAYEAPRLIDMPSIKMSALWLAGPKNIFIPVADIGTELSDPFAVDENYLDKVRARAEAQERANADARRQAIEDDEDPSMLGGGGLRPPGNSR